MAGIGYNPNERVPGYTPDKYEREALEIMAYEKSEWDDEAVWLDEKLQYLMRNVIKKARKNYMGVFDKPRDEVTGEDKTWVPLTEYLVDSVRKSVDLDTKDILIQPGNPAAVGVTPIIKGLVENTLKKIEFGQLLNDSILVLSRDGTVVVKTVTEINPKTGKKEIRSYIVNLLNFWIDPSARTVQESATLERIPMSEADIQAMSDVWDNTQYVNFSLAVPKIVDTWGSTTGKMPYTEVWERWGKIKKSWVTKNDSDANTWVEGHIVGSGIGTAKIIHKIRINPRKDGVKPYEECWYKRLDGRWYGRGVAEMLFQLQEYVNITVNIRKSNALVLQNGIFLIRKGSGVTPDMISSISAGGGVPVTDINKDIKQLQTQDYRASSYQDEDRAYLLSDRVTGAYDINRGEAGRTSASATATLTQDRHIRDTFVLIQEGIGFFMERLIVRHYIPLLKELMKTEDIIKITGEPQYLSEIDSVLIEHRVNDFVNKEISNTGFYPEQDKVDAYRAAQSKGLKRMGKTRFVQYFRGMFDENVDVEVTVTDERFNRVVAVQQLRDMLIAFSRLPVASSLNTDAILKEIVNLMGLKGDFFLNEKQAPTLQSGLGQTGRQLKELPGGMPSEAGALQNAAGIQQGGPQSGGGVPDFQTRLNINTPLAPLGQVR